MQHTGNSSHGHSLHAIDVWLDLLPHYIFKHNESMNVSKTIQLAYNTSK